jgi:hypothetical protein
MNRKKSRIILTLFALCALLFESCLVDIPTPANSPVNNQKIIIPPVFNSALNDSINSFISYSNTILKSADNSIETREIINSKHHLAFTDLIKYNGAWYVAFRFSDGHVATNFGHIIIAKSENLERWESEQIYTQNNYDLRDPKLFIKDSVLCIHFHSATINPYAESRNDYIAKYDIENNRWGKAIKINKNTNEKSWFWRLTEHNNKVYTIAYRGGEPLKLFISNNGTDFNEQFRFENIQGRASETTLRFDKDTVYALIRREGEGALLGKSSVSDMTQWTFIDFPWVSMGGPNFLIYKDKLLITGRINGQPKLYSYSLNSNTLTQIGSLPGGFNETGYCGMFLEEDILYLAYYTGIKDRGFSIKFSRVNLKGLPVK